MPLIIFFSSFICFFLFQKSLKYFIYTAIFFVCLISFFIKYPLIERIDVQLKNFIKSSVNIIVEVPKIFYSNSSDEIKSWTPDGYIIHFNSGVQLWKKNKIIGNGIKSLPIYCKYENNTTCNTHPHNYFIEILMDTGIIGLSLIYSIFIFGLVKSIKHYLRKNKKKITYISIPIFLIIFFEFFPLRSTGSFFTTSVASIIFTFFPMFLSIEKIKFYNK
jgi:O-antigen ligase